jgi:hypothetical protein
MNEQPSSQMMVEGDCGRCTNKRSKHFSKRTNLREADGSIKQFIQENLQNLAE